jgi:uncharacterized protein YecE (DUF72 family)
VLYIGSPLWSNKEWVGNFFPAKTPQSDFLRLYSRKLSAVEGNTTFYAMPSEETIARWRQETPVEFRFCPKVSREISHSLHLDTCKAEVEAFTGRMRGLGERLGPMFLQLPPGFAPDHVAQLEGFLSFWPRDVRLAVEVRHPAFFMQPHTSTLNALLRRYNVARVIMDSGPIRVGSAEEKQVLQARERKPDLPVELTLTADLAFVRYIGHPRMEVNEQFFATWAEQLAQWLRQEVTLYVFCHCPFQVHSPEICAALYERVRALVPLPELAQTERDEQPEQAKLF